MDDRSLIADFLRNRGEKEFTDLYRAHTPALYRIALRLVPGDVAEAEELVQQMWCVAIESLNTFQWKSTLKTWLCGILINLSHAKHREKKFSDLPQRETQSKNGYSILAHDLETAITKLPVGYRQVLILHDLEGYTHNEIAEILQVSEGTCKSQLFNARKAMRRILQSNYNHDE